MTEGTKPRPDLARSLRALAGSVVALLRTRLELVANEFEEEGIRLGKIAALAVAAMFFATLALIFVSIFVVVALWPTHPLLGIAVLAVLYALAGVYCVFQLKTAWQAKPRLFAATLAELAKDRARLLPGGDAN